MSLKNNKSLGQHWLTDRTILDAIADFAIYPEANSEPMGDSDELCNDAHERHDSTNDESCIVDTCLEIGPGLGTLTSSLLKRFNKVVAVEYDEHLAKNLPNSFPGKNLEVINADFLDFDLETISEPYVVAGNIPYYITSPIITKLLTSKNPPQKIVLLIQKEVAERIVSEKSSYLSLFVENCALVESGFVVPRNYFTPPPKVDSATIAFIPKTPKVSESILSFIKQCFKNPRKKLLNNLPFEKSTILNAFSAIGISENARPADLSLETYEKLYAFLMA